MELSPKAYNFFVRPKWYTHRYIHHISNELFGEFDFDNKKVLDFGCGVGSNSCMFDHKGYIGIDCDSRRINYAKRLFPEYDFSVCVGNELPFLSHSFDYILIMAVLHHIPPRQRQIYLQEFYRILKPDGKVMVIEPCIFKGSALNNWWMQTFDKGKFISNEQQYLTLFQENHYSTKILKKFKKCFVYNEVSFLAFPIM